MNLADSVKNVLKNRSHKIFNEFWKSDFKLILLELKNDITEAVKNSSSSLKQVKQDGLKVSLKELLDSGADSLLIIKVLPKRIKKGFIFFKNDLLNELDHLVDKKHKSVFCLKVFGALTTFTLSVVYGIKRGTTDFSIKGLKRRNAFTNFLVAELVIKVTTHFLHRFLEELEKEIDDPEELKKILYFKGLLTDRSQYKEEELVLQPNDRAIQIVEDLKTYIMTGKRKNDID